MAKSTATTVEEYLASLDGERRDVVAKVREVILRHLPKGYVESLNWGMLSYEIPLERYPKTYNGQPLAYAALAAQKNHYALYLTFVHGHPEREQALADAFRNAGKKMDMGKSCLRFKKLDDIPLDAIGTIIAGTPPDTLIAEHEAARTGRK